MPVTPFEMVLRMGTAIVLGAAIGYERGRSDHPAGLRTHILVALASATFMLVSTQFVYFQHYAQADLIHVDPSRIASGVVMGIGFLGAGSILRMGPDVHGLTTAASLWLVTAVGLAAGSGMFPEAATATAVALFVLVGLTYVETKHKLKVSCMVQIDFEGSGLSRSELVAELGTQGAAVTNFGVERNVKNNRTRLLLELGLRTEAAVEPIVRHLLSLPGAQRVKVRQPRPRP